MWVFIGMIPLSLYLIRPFQRLNHWYKSLAHICFVLQIIHCNIYGFSISISKLSLATKNPQQIELSLCGFQVAASTCIIACYITTTLIKFVATIKWVVGTCIWVSPHYWGIKKEWLCIYRTTKDNFGYLFILHYNCNGLMYANR
jgi:hypothetical protein